MFFYKFNKSLFKYVAFRKQTELWLFPELTCYSDQKGDTQIFKIFPIFLFPLPNVEIFINDLFHSQMLIEVKSHTFENLIFSFQG